MTRRERRDAWAEYYAAVAAAVRAEVEEAYWRDEESAFAASPRDARDYDALQVTHDAAWAEAVYARRRREDAAEEAAASGGPVLYHSYPLAFPEDCTWVGRGHLDDWWPRPCLGHARPPAPCVCRPAGFTPCAALISLDEESPYCFDCYATRVLGIPGRLCTHTIGGQP